MPPRDPGQMIFEQLHALAARGVDHFPIPPKAQKVDPFEPSEPQPTTASNVPSEKEATVAPMQKSANVPAQMPSSLSVEQTKTAPLLKPSSLSPEHCQQCPLARGRKCVVFDRDVTPKRILVVSDFPGPEDEEEGRPFATPTSRHRVLHSLLARVGQDVHRSFAIKCSPRKGIPNETQAICSGHLAAEIEQITPATIWCFGNRALRSTELALGTRFFDVPELGVVGCAPFAGKNIEVVVLPSSRELEAHTEWRLPVWEVLKGLLRQI